MDSKDTFVCTERRNWYRARHSYSPNNEYWITLRAKYGMQWIRGNSMPYFSITATGSDQSGGCQHEAIAEIFPELRDLIPLHLLDQDGCPMHYVANATYWFDMATGHVKPDASYRQPVLDVLRQHILVGTISSDESILGMAIGLTKGGHETARELFKEWLEARRPALKARFLATMKQYGVQLIDTDRYNT